MRGTTRTLALLVLGGGVLAACTSSEAKPAAGVPQAGEPIPMSAEVRAKFVEELHADLAVIDAAIKRLAEHAEVATLEARAEARTRLLALRDRSAALGSGLEKARTAEEAAWSAQKAKLRSSYEELKASVEQTRRWLDERRLPSVKEVSR